MKDHRLNPLLLFIMILGGLMLSTCAVNPVTGKKELMFMSEEQEIALGQQSDPSIVAMYGLYEDETLQEFINKKGQEMAAISHRPHLKYEFKILDSPVVNAFALPGGYVYFTRGILAHFNNEAEFAGVLGHEIGHITARHGASQQTKATFAQILFVGGLVVSPTFRAFANEGQQVMQLLFLKYSRDNESQSDELGVAYSTKIGYNAHHMANFFQTLDRMRDNSGASSLPTFLSTHPDPYDRFNTVHKLAAEAQDGLDTASLATNRDPYLKMIDGMIYGEDPRQGYVENEVFYHPELRFQFPVPKDWNTVNSPSQVQMAPKDGSALMILTLTEAASLEAAANSILEQYSLTQIERKNLTLNNMPVLAMVSEQTNTQTNQTIRVLTYLISYNNLIYTFHGVSEKTAFDNMVPFFNQTMRNFKSLSDPAKINKKPRRLSIRTANQNTSLRNLLTSQGVPQDQLDEHAVINGKNLDDAMKRGDMFKVVK